MIFGGGKKASQKELRGKIEGILSILDEMAPVKEREDGADQAESIASVKKSVEELHKRAKDLTSAQQRLQSEYKRFVDDCQGKEDLSEGGRYQLASDFFSFHVAESAKCRKSAEALSEDLSKLSEGLDRYAKDSAGAAKSDIKKLADKARKAVLELAAALSV